jgi:hypothetical protein
VAAPAKKAEVSDGMLFCIKKSSGREIHQMVFGAMTGFEMQFKVGIDAAILTTTAKLRENPSPEPGGTL